MALKRLDNMTSSRVARIIAAGFAAGATVHAVGFVLIWFGIYWYGPGYPPWRHAVMATVDSSVAWVALKRPIWLFVALPPWIAEQWVMNGFGPFTLIAVIFLIALAWEHSCGTVRRGKRAASRFVTTIRRT
jgi:hypothetical protein